MGSYLPLYLIAIPLPWDLPQGQNAHQVHIFERNANRLAGLPEDWSGERVPGFRYPWPWGRRE